MIYLCGHQSFTNLLTIMEQVKSKSYTLRTETGSWLGQVVLTDDGMFASVTDYGNMSYAWRSYGDAFRAFILSLNVGYFADKMYTGMAYMVHGKKYAAACERFAEKILPALQKALSEEWAAENAAKEITIDEDEAPVTPARPLDANLCPSCNNRPKAKEHTCPYAEEINFDTIPCVCCPHCTGDCADRI
jgi:hypothetical protein